MTITRIATWNVNSLRVRLPHVLEWLAANPVEVLAIQETKLTDPHFPCAELEALGYQVLYSARRLTTAWRCYPVGLARTSCATSRTSTTRRGACWV